MALTSNNISCTPIFCTLGGCLLALLLFHGPVCFAQEDSSEVINIRLANGAPVEGVFKAAAPDGLTIQTERGIKTLPWKYLSAGTRWRYERPMLAELEAKRIKAEKEAKAKAEAAAKAAAAKAAAGTNKTAGTTANPAQPKATDPTPAGVASNKPAAKTK